MSGCAERASGELDGAALDQGLQLPSGASVSSATYLITGPNGFASAGTVAVGDSPDVQVVVSHLPVGQGYELRVSALASDGVTECDGTTTFDVVDSSLALTLTVHLECAVPTGDLNVVATVNLCPVLAGLSASPLAVTLGGVSTLQIEAHDADNGPASLAYRWKINGFTLAGQTSPALSFFCSSPGSLTITGTVSDGDPNPTCAASASATVSCQ